MDTRLQSNGVRITEYRKANPNAPHHKIARDLNIHEATVQRHIKRIEAAEAWIAAMTQDTKRKESR